MNGQRTLADSSRETIRQKKKREEQVGRDEDHWEDFEGFEIKGQETVVQAVGSHPQNGTAGKVASKTSKGRSKGNKPDQSNQSYQYTTGNAFESLAVDRDESQNELVDVSAWKSLHLSPQTLSSLGRLKFSYPTPIQRSAIPHILAKHDAICKAPTGSGKTLGFGIPIYEHFLQARGSQTRSAVKKDKLQKQPPIALILSPTRELAHQLTAHLRELCSDPRHSSPIIATLTGGLSLLKQQRLVANADIIIGTPGRLWEIISNSPEIQRSIRQIKYLVLDEADRLLSTGHFQEVEEILNSLDRSEVESNENDEEDNESVSRHHRQTLVFSATFEKELQQRLAGKSKSSNGDPSRQQSMDYLFKKLSFRDEKPKFIDVNPSAQMASGLKEGLIECAGTDKVPPKSSTAISTAKCQLTNPGPLSLLPAALLSPYSYAYLHELNHLCPPARITSPKSLSPRVSTSLSNAPESSPPLDRAVLNSVIIIYPYRH